MCRASIQCIIPPYMVDKLVESGSKTVSARGIENKFRSYRFRSDRIFFSAVGDSVRASLGFRRRARSAKPVLEVYTATNKTSLPGRLLKRGKSGYSDKDAERVYQGGLHTWNLYYEMFGRNSIDANGMAIVQSVHYGVKYQNAFWNGRQMVYGDGDGTIFGSFTSDVDIIGHELTHGVMQYASNLDYQNQSGALNESFSDVFGIMVKQRVLNHDVKASDWLIGANVLIGDEYAIRSMKEPGSAYRNHPVLGSDPQPATMADYRNLPNTPEGDWGGVHINSGIPNFAFYVAALNRGGYAWNSIGRIWYTAMTDIARMPRNATFATAREATLYHARQLFGEGSLELNAVTQGWKEAGVD